MNQGKITCALIFAATPALAQDSEAMQRAFMVWNIEGAILLICSLAALVAVWCAFGTDSFFGLKSSNDFHREFEERHAEAVRFPNIQRGPAVLDERYYARVTGFGTVCLFLGSAVGRVEEGACGFLLDDSMVKSLDSSEIVVFNRGKVMVAGSSLVHAFDHATVFATAGDADIYAYGPHVRVVTDRTWRGKLTRVDDAKTAHERFFGAVEQTIKVANQVSEIS